MKRRRRAVDPTIQLSPIEARVVGALLLSPSRFLPLIPEAHNGGYMFHAALRAILKGLRESDQDCQAEDVADACEVTATDALRALAGGQSLGGWLMDLQADATRETPESIHAAAEEMRTAARLASFTTEMRDLFADGVKFLGEAVTDPTAAGALVDSLTEQLTFIRLNVRPGTSTLLRNVVSASDLGRQVFEPIRWVVPGILPEGLCFLAGAPKAGKSRLSLSLSVAVATGGLALGSIPVDPGSVLVLALEDPLRRLQERIGQLTGNAPFPDRLHVVPVGGWAALTKGGTTAIREWLDLHPDARMVVIDTLGKVRPPMVGKSEDAYLRDTELLAPLLQLAGERHICILILTHTRKSNGLGDDWLETIHGSIGQTGAADCVLLLERSRHKREGSLRGTGRDLPNDIALALEADQELGGWRLLGPLEENQGSKERRAIIEVLRESGRTMTPSEVSQLTGDERNAVKKLMWTMEKSGEIEADHKGRYSLRSL